MKRSVFFSLAALLVCLCVLSVGCKKNVPIQDVTNGSISAYGKKTPNQVRDAILRGGAKIGWQMQEEKPGLIVATWAAREHSLIVEIPYTPESYTIRYRSSVNMDEKDGTIHRNYPRWIDRLNRNINAELTAPK